MVSMIKGGKRICKKYNDGRGYSGCDDVDGCDVKLPSGKPCLSTKHDMGTPSVGGGYTTRPGLRRQPTLAKSTMLRNCGKPARAGGPSPMPMGLSIGGLPIALLCMGATFYDIVIGGGSPCQGNSSLNARRKGLGDPVHINLSSTR